MSLYQAAKYGSEFAAYYPRYVRELDAQDLDPCVREMFGGAHTGSVGGSIIGAALYDISTVAGNRVKEERDKIRLVAGMTMWYFDLIDDASDQSDIYLTADEKREALITVAANSLERTDPSLLPDSRFYRAAFHLGTNIYEAVGQDPVAETFRRSVELALQTELKAVDGMHLESHIDYAINIGKACGSVLAGVVEYVRGEPDEAMVVAAQALGAYGELLDHAYEINEDLQSGNSTFATEMIYTHGDTWAARQDAREALLGSAQHYRRQGKEVLSKKQQKMFDAVVTLCDLRYKVIVNLRDHRLGKQRERGSAAALSYQ